MLTVESGGVINSLNMPITIWKVKLDGITIGEFRLQAWAELFATAAAASLAKTKD